MDEESINMLEMVERTKRDVIRLFGLREIATDEEARMYLRKIYENLNIAKRYILEGRYVRTIE
jgi:hypothetical protein